MDYIQKIKYNYTKKLLNDIAFKKITKKLNSRLDNLILMLPNEYRCILLSYLIELNNFEIYKQEKLISFIIKEEILS